MPAVARSAPGAAVAGFINDAACARLVALEPLLDAVTALLDAGETSRAKALAHAWKTPRQ